MKRALSPDLICGSATRPIKREKPSPTDYGTSQLPSPHPPSFSCSSRPDVEHQKTSIQNWINSSGVSDIDMAPPRSSSAASIDSVQRRASKLGIRRRSQSPVKKDSTQYRSRNMADVKIFVEHYPEPPLIVADKLKAIFKVTELGSIGNGPPGLVDPSLSRQYCAKSRHLAKICAGESQWKSSMIDGLLEPIQALWPGTLMPSSAEKPWIAGLRPTPRSLEDILGAVPVLGDRPLTETLTNLSYAPSDTVSDITTDDPNRISIPKPDITIGLAHDAFNEIHGKILWQMQDNEQVLSDPHQSGVGMHFPFFVVEVKALASGSNLFAAQNQVAVDATCALRIFQSLGAQAGKPDVTGIFFSISTEGPIHELWVHYQIEDSYHMTILRVWRSTLEKDSLEFVQSLYHILEWGQGALREDIKERLDDVITGMRSIPSN